MDTLKNRNLAVVFAACLVADTILASYLYGLMLRAMPDFGYFGGIPACGEYNLFKSLLNTSSNCVIQNRAALIFIIFCVLILSIVVIIADGLLIKRRFMNNKI